MSTPKDSGPQPLEDELTLDGETLSDLDAPHDEVIQGAGVKYTYMAGGGQWCSL